jgi:hypothetical protein
MKLEIGKLYKLNFGKSLTKDAGSNYYAGDAKQGSIVLLLDFGNFDYFSKFKVLRFDYFSKFKVLTEDGIIGWIVTNISAERWFSTNIE